MTKFFTLLLLAATTSGLTQTVFSPPKSTPTETAPSWHSPKAVDSCGAYFNNYIGLTKTSSLYFEEMRTGDATYFDAYSGRGQRFHAPQPIEISGLQFFSFQTNPDVDSLMVITLLYDYNAEIDSVGAELARDTVYVSHTAFTPLLTEIEVNSYFDEPVVVSEDYIVGLYTETNDSLKIITSSAPDSDGEGEGVSFAYYENPAAPSFTGWYPTLPTFGPSYDLDYLISPLVKYDLHDGFTLSNDTVCPNVMGEACVEYAQMPVFSDPHYNAHSNAPLSKITWRWGDGLQNNDLTSLCHTYTETGDFEITLIDTISKHVFADPYCAIEVIEPIHVRDSVELAAIFGATGLNVTFDGTVTNSDSLSWNFGDGGTSMIEDPSYSYSEPGTYEVWLYAHGCNTDSVSVLVDVSDVGLSENKINFNYYPNPANEQLMISGYESNLRIEILNVFGQVIFQTETSAAITTVNTTQFSSGTYFIRLSGADKTSTAKFIIKH